MRGLGIVETREVTTTRDIKPYERHAWSRSSLASCSIEAHVLRGAAGLIAAALAVGLLAPVGPLALAILALTALAWRGCLTCWTVGLIGPRADRRARSSCGAAGCRCRRAARDLSLQRAD